MDYQRLAYDDAATTRQMAADCAAVDQALHPHGHLPAQRHVGSEDAAGADVADGGHGTVAPGTVVVSDDLAALAAGLELHFN